AAAGPAVTDFNKPFSFESQCFLPVRCFQRQPVPEAVYHVVHPVPLAALVDHRFAPFLPGFRFRGRPPSLPFSLELWALRFERTAPRQAGQKQTSGTLCIGHRFMGPSMNLTRWDVKVN